MREITANQLLYKSILMQYEWAESQDWTGYTREQREQLETKKGVEIYNQLKKKYGVL